LRVNREIRAPRVRVISESGEQLGVVSIQEAMAFAKEAGLDLVEVVATSTPPVCKIIDYGKFRYDQTKRERDNRKTQHQVKVKEVKFGLNISEHDLEVKLRKAKDFLGSGNKVKCSCMFRGREMAHPEVGKKLMSRVEEILSEVSMVEATPKMYGRFLTMVLAPVTRKK